MQLKQQIWSQNNIISYSTELGKSAEKWSSQPYWFQCLYYNRALHNKKNLRVALFSGYPHIYWCKLTTTEVDLYCACNVANCFKFDKSIFWLLKVVRKCSCWPSDIPVGKHASDDNIEWNHKGQTLWRSIHVETDISICSHAHCRNSHSSLLLSVKHVNHTYFSAMQVDTTKKVTVTITWLFRCKDYMVIASRNCGNSS